MQLPAEGQSYAQLHCLAEKRCAVSNQAKVLLSGSADVRGCASLALHSRQQDGHL